MAVIVNSFQDAVAFQPEKFNPVRIAGSERVKAVLTCLEPGQFIPVHKPGVDMLLAVLEGTGEVAAGDRFEHVGAGALIFVPAGEARGLRAETRLVALHVVTPVPTEADHAGVAAMLRQGTWR